MKADHLWQAYGAGASQAATGRGARTGAVGQAVAEVSGREAGQRTGDEVGLGGSLDLGRP